MAYRLGAIAVVVASVALAAMACGGDDDKTVDVPGGGDVEVTEGRLPDDWPDEFPVYSGADLLGSVRGEEDGAEGVVVTWETDDSLEDVKAFYDEELDDGEWQATGSGSFEDSAFWTVENSDGDREAQITIASGDKTSIIVFLGEGLDLGGGSQETPADDESGSEGGADGSAELPEESELPSGFPADRVSLPGDARIVSATTTSGGGQAISFVEFLTQDSVQETADALKSSLEDDGWTQVSTSEADGDIFATYSGGEGGTESVSVSIADSQYEGYTQVDLGISLAQ